MLRTQTTHIRRLLFKRKYEEHLQFIDDCSPNEMRTAIQAAIYDSAAAAFGTCTFSQEDQIASNASLQIILIEEKRKALITYNKNKTQITQTNCVPQNQSFKENQEDVPTAIGRTYVRKYRKPLMLAI